MLFPVSPVTPPNMSKAANPNTAHLALIGTAFPMPVAAPLLAASLTEPDKAIAMINVFSRATLAAPPSAFGPGTWVHGASTALNRRVLASNREVNLLHQGFTAPTGPHRNRTGRPLQAY